MWSFNTSIGSTIEPLTGEELAKRAVKSVKDADLDRDGITYLQNAIKNGISTPLTPEYKREILRLTNTDSLESALVTVRSE